MPSSYTTSLRLTLPVSGELAGSWGSTVNTGVTSLAEAAIAGTAAVAMSDADATLTVLNGAADQSRNMFITLTGALTATRNVICPSVSKMYVVTNSTTGGQTITFKTAAGSGIAVANGQRKTVYCNGTNVLDATTGFTSLLFDAGTVGAPSIAFAGNASTGFWLPTTSTLAASTAGVERLRISASGNVGIGTTTPLVPLEVNGAFKVQGVTTNNTTVSLTNADFLASKKVLVTFPTASGWNGQIQVYSSRPTADGTGAQRILAEYTITRSGAATGSFAYFTVTSGQKDIDSLAPSASFIWYFDSATGTPYLRFSQTGNSFSFVVVTTLTLNTLPTVVVDAGTAPTGTVVTPLYELASVAAGGMSLSTVGTERLRVDNSGLLGVGKTPSLTQVDIQQTSTYALGLTTATRNYAFRIDSGFADALVINNRTSSTDLLSLSTVGNLGLGVTPSAWGGSGLKAIDVSTAGAFVASPNAVEVYLNSYYNGTSFIYKNTAVASRYEQSLGAHKWYNAPSGTAGTAITFTQAMTLDANGCLGLSLLTPSAWGLNYKAVEIGGAGSAIAANGPNTLVVGTGSYFNAAGNNIYTVTGTGVSRYVQTVGQHQWLVAPAGTAGNTITFTQAMTLDASGNLGIGTTTPLNTLDVVGSFGRGSPVTKTANFTLADTENWLINNKSGSACTVTLPAASLWTGREVMIQNYQAQTVISASANVVPKSGAAAGTAILPATIGSSVTLVSNGTSWVIAADNLFAAVSGQTGTGALVFATSPTLVTPNLGTPSALTLTSATGLPLTTGVTGTLPVANGGTGITALGTGVATWLGTPTSANLASAVTDETGTGSLVFATSPTLTTPTLGAATLSSINGGQIAGMRNRIINGDMHIDQRFVGGSTTPTIDQYTIDRWVTVLTKPSKFSVQLNAGAVGSPPGFSGYLGVTSLSAYAVTATDFFSIAQNIEGYNCSDFGWGTASAKTVTLSFVVRSSLTGTFGGTINNIQPGRCYPFTYTISSANTWETKSVTIPGETSGTWPVNNTLSIQVRFSLGAGSTLSGTAFAWTSTELAAPTGAVSVVGTSGATFYVTGVQFEIGSVATPFEYLSESVRLLLCQRYYYKTNLTSVQTFGSGQVASATVVIVQTPFPVTMRTTPAALEQTGVAGNYAVSSPGSAVVVCTTVPIRNPGTSQYIGVSNFESTGLGGTSGQASVGLVASGSNAYLAWSAEL